MPFELALLRALLAACAAALLLQALPTRAPRLLDQALDLATVPVAANVPRGAREAFLKRRAVRPGRLEPTET